MIKDELRLEVSKRLKEDLLDPEFRKDLNKMPESLGMVAIQVHRLNILIEEVFDYFEAKINES